MEELLTQPNHYTQVFRFDLTDDAKKIQDITESLSNHLIHELLESNKISTLVVNVDVFNNHAVRRYNFRLDDLSEVEIIIRESLKKEEIND